MLAVHRPDGSVLLASSAARGFVAEEPAIAAQTRAGKQVFNLEEGERADGRRSRPTATTSRPSARNRKLLIFPLAELPVMSRGKGVLLQRYSDGELADAAVLRLDDGLSWPAGKGTRTVTDLAPWLGRRGQAGRVAPHGFPRSNRFDS